MSGRVWQGGMIGAGAWSAVQLEAWSQVTGARIVALADRHPERRTPVARQFGVPHEYDDVATMLERGDLDFIDICTRPYSHAGLVKQVAGRRLPILCQKPFCTTLDEARDVVKACRQAGVRLMVNENFRWQAWFQKARALLDEGALGPPFLAVMHQRSRLSLPRFTHAQTYLREMPRALLYEFGTHQLDVMRFLFGEPETVYARLHRVSPEFAGEDVETIVLGYTGMTCVIYDSWASVPMPDTDRPAEPRRWNPRLLEIDGVHGTFSIRADGSVHLFTDTDHQQWATAQDTIPRSHTRAQQHFIDCLESGAEFATNGEETLKTMALVYACYQSSEEGRVVRPAEVRV
jgi:predicted dehydrogenase